MPLPKKRNPKMERDIIREWRKGKQTQMQLAQKHGISQSLVWQIVNGRVNESVLQRK